MPQSKSVHRMKNLAACLLICLCTLPTWGLSLQSDTPELKLLQGIELLEDPTTTLGLDEVTQGAAAQQFKALVTTPSYLNLGFSQSAYWLKIPLQQGENAPSQWILELSNFKLDQVDFFAPGKAPIITGSTRPLNSRPVFHRFFAFPLEVTPQNQYFYLRVQSQDAITLPLTLWQTKAFDTYTQETTLLHMLYTGGVLSLLIYNMFLYFSLRDLRFLLYSVFALLVGLGMFAGNGFGRLFLWPDWMAFDGLSQFIFFSAAGAATMQFSCHFLQTRHTAPRMHSLFQLLTLLYIGNSCGLLLSLWLPLPTQFLLMLLSFISIPAGLALIGISIHLMRKGQRGVHLFLLAWGTFALGVIGASLRPFGLIPTNVFTSYILQISSAFEMLFISFALADLIHIERKSREDAQLKALELNNQIIEGMKSSEEKLELAVKERTLQLEQALGNEKHLHEQFVRFGALISHEFRNPLGIIDSQTSLMRKELERGLSASAKRLEVISSATKRLTLMFDRWLQGDRLNKSLQEIEVQEIPIQSWLRAWMDNTVNFQASHRIELRLSPEVDKLIADESLLNIALYNLVENACKYSEQGETVSIETRYQPGMTGIAVVDHGKGIDPQHHEHIFQDYYRVHPEGPIQGLGLGLQFVKRIANAHDADVEVKSIKGMGSTFCIWFKEATPLKGKHEH